MVSIKLLLVASLTLASAIALQSAPQKQDSANASPASAQTLPTRATVVDGHRAVQYPLVSGACVSIRLAQTREGPAFEVPLTHVSMGGLFGNASMYKGRLYISQASLTWIPSDPGDMPFRSVISQAKFGTASFIRIQVEAAGKKYAFTWGNEPEPCDLEAPLWRPEDMTRMGRAMNELLLSWLRRAATDFDGAKREFDRLTGSVATAAGLADFSGQAAAWRAAGGKVELPEQAERHRVVAEAAYQERNFEKAVSEYREGLNVYPTWPQGQFNIAMLLAELKQYPEAIAHMKAYLQLVPDAANAQEAKQQMWIWEDKTESGVGPTR